MVSFLAQVVLCIAGVCLSKYLLKEVPRAQWIGHYRFGWRVWTLEAATYAYLVSNFYWETAVIVKDLSDRYKHFLVDERRARPNVSGLHESWLSASFLKGRLIDLKDAQYHEFRNNLPTLAVVSVVYLAGSTIIRKLSSKHSRRTRAKMRASYILMFGIGASLFFHEADTVKILALCGTNFLLSQQLIRKGQIGIALLWIFNLLILYCNDTYKGYRFENMLGSTDISKYLDSRSGDLAWHHSFNLIMLRMMSFNMDYWWAVQFNESKKNQGATKGLDPDSKKRPKYAETKVWNWDDDSKAIQESKLDEKSRVGDLHPLEIYNDPILYFAHLLYLPLYIAGPTITFNCFVSHLAIGQTTYSLYGKFKYAFRFFATLFLFELLTHYFYVGAISNMAFRYRVNESGNRTPLLVYLARKTDDHQVLDEKQIVYYSYWALMFLWFKFLLIWRLFRLWAICDDIEPVENMERCMNNNYTIGGFWRGWHRSFNRWLVRYIYVPLGGGNVGMIRRALNILIVFTFVGFWHDLKIELFAWGWLLSLFFVPEIVAGKISRLQSVSTFFIQNPLIASWLISFCGACNIIMLKVANIVGYTTGLEGAALLVPAVKTRQGFLFALEYLLFMTVGVQIMFFIRETRGEKN